MSDVGPKKAQIIGRLGRDPARTTLSDGAMRTVFSVAVNERRRRGADPEAGDLTTWFRVSAYWRLGELTATLLRQGMIVHAAGDPHLRLYAGPRGEPRACLIIRLESFEILDRPAGDPVFPTDFEVVDLARDDGEERDRHPQANGT
ncbi:MAG TPA: single-stranded DNA-binding protein [Chloroflexota bacterium]|nr:single-stranded DNA-binding protein [Chloroflexota bacterium]